MTQINTTALSVAEADTVQVISAIEGDQQAWTQLVRQHQTAVFRLAYLTLSDSAEAEDVAQDVFIRAHQKLHLFDPKRPFRPWLLQITINLARNRRRSLGRYWQAIQRYLHNYQDETIITAPEFNHDSRQVWQAVKQLRPKAQEVIHLRYFLELSEAETAVALNIPPGTVKSRLHRALKQLRQIIEQDFPDLHS